MKKLVLSLAPLAFALAGPVAAETPKASTPVESYGDWRLHCAEIAKGEKVCALHQKLISEQTKLPVANFAIARHKDSKELRLTAILPLGLDIPVPITGQAGSAPAFTYKLQTCLPRGCIANVAIDDAMLKAMEGSPSFTITFKMRAVAAPTTFTVSLKGLDQGLKALDAK